MTTNVRTIPAPPTSLPPQPETDRAADELQRQDVQAAFVTNATRLENFRRDLNRRVDTVQLGTDMVLHSYMQYMMTTSWSTTIHTLYCSFKK